MCIAPYEASFYLFIFYAVCVLTSACTSVNPRSNIPKSVARIGEVQEDYPAAPLQGERACSFFSPCTKSGQSKASVETWHVRGDARNISCVCVNTEARAMRVFPNATCKKRNMGSTGILEMYLSTSLENA